MRRITLPLLFALAAAPAFAKEPAPSHDPRAAFAESDENKDNRVDREEFHHRVVEIFFHGDGDKDGYMTREELIATVVFPEDFKGADRDGDGRQEVFTAGRLGVHAHSLGKDGTWKRTEIAKGNPAPYPDGGASEIGTGFVNKARFYATVEPFHGNMVVVYRQDGQGQWQRHVIDTELSNGHSLVVADVDGDGTHEIVASGTRGGKHV